MSTTANILTLLKFYCSKQKTPIVEYDEFSDYIHRYAQHHLEENPNLITYAGSSFGEALHQELNQLITEKHILIAPLGKKDAIFVISAFMEKYSAIYNHIEGNIAVPFPSTTDIPKHVPKELLTNQPSTNVIYQALEKQEALAPGLYSVVFGKQAPSILFPTTTPMSQIVDLALKKIRELLNKDESHDYFLKKLTVANPGKEIAVKSFFSQLVNKPEQALALVKETGETYYYWTMLCHYLKQDYNKVKDFTTEDINILQSVSILEVAISYYKSKAGERMKKESAFKVLDGLLENPPYYYNWSDICKMKDSNGQFLLGQYTEDDLKKYLNTASTESVRNELPRLLVFKVNETEGYFINKTKVMPLIIRLCNDARIVVRESLIREWYNVLYDYETLPEMKEPAAFERCLERELKVCDPVLYAILNASFLPVISYEDNTPGHIHLYRNDSLVPYSELLMVSRPEILSDAKIKLPFWYSMPLLSWIMKLIFHKPKEKKNKKPKEKKAATAIYIQEEKDKENEKLNTAQANDHSDPKLSRKKELRKQAAEAEKILVPENSSLDRELKGYLHEWNDRIGKENYNNLTEDINSLIRDYMRKVLHSIRGENLTLERISSLAQSLVDAPSMVKIRNHPALKRYIELYIVKLVKNLP